MFTPTSRYAALPELSFEGADGKVHLYKARRFPPTRPPRPMRSVSVRDGERLDHIAAAMLGDPLAFWRIADANGAMDPFALTRPGARLLIPAVGFDAAEAS